MAAIDKMNEFYICADRFKLLARLYRPEELPDTMNAALDLICTFFESDPAFLENLESAKDYFNEAEDSFAKLELADVLSRVIKNSVR